MLNYCAPTCGAQFLQVSLRKIARHVIHLNFRTGSTFPVPVFTVSPGQIYIYIYYVGLNIYIYVGLYIHVFIHIGLLYVIYVGLYEAESQKNRKLTSTKFTLYIVKKNEIFICLLHFRIQSNFY